MGNALVDQFTSAYRSVFRFGLQSNESVESVAEYYVRDWLAGRRGGQDSEALDEWDGVEDLSLPSGAKVEAIWFEDERNRRNAVRYRVTDSVEDGNIQVRVSVMSSGLPGREVVFLVEVLRDFGDAERAAHDIHPPRIVKNILDTRSVFDGDSHLQGQPRGILRRNVGELLDAVADSDRQVPLLVACSVNVETDEQWRSVIQQLTRSTVGTAAVYVVYADAVDALNSRLPETLQIQAGHMRAIAPRVDMENPVVRRHPLWKPQELGSFLDRNGKVKDEAVGAVAEGPRTRLLESNLPPEVRRIVQLLDQEERKKKLSDTVDERVTEVAQTEQDSADLVEQTVAASSRAFPSRSEVHAREQSGDDFWATFQALLARWLDKDSSEVTESSVDQDLRAVDELILRDREALRVNEQYLEKVEGERNDLGVAVSELREENDSLQVQLEAAKRAEEEALDLVQTMRKQLEELKVVPRETVRIEREPRRVGELQDKVKQVEVAGGAEATREQFEPHAEVGKALQLLAERLDPIIENKLKRVLGETPWTEVLVAKDKGQRGSPRIYRRNDPGAQLRMLTERIGTLNYPFEVDSHRSVSNLAGRLRKHRNFWSHHQEFHTMDVARVYDDMYLLLGYLGDEEGAAKAKAQRDHVHAILGMSSNPAATQPNATPRLDATSQPLFTVRESAAQPLFGAQPEGSTEFELASRSDRPISGTPIPKVSTSQSPANASESSEMAPESGGSVDESGSEPELSSSETLSYESLGPETPEQASVQALPDAPYVGWDTEESLPTSQLMRTGLPHNRRKVREKVERIVEFEQPILLDRLVGLVAREFSVDRVHSDRARHIKNQIRQAQVVVDGDGYVWSKDLDREAWGGFRPTSRGDDREFTQISPVEVRNAALFVLESDPGIPREDLEYEVLRIFDRQRRTGPVSEHLNRALKDLD